MRYKASWPDTQIVEADQWYPSSKTGSACAVIKRDLGREPNWVCPNCGARNQNATRNRRKLAPLAVDEEDVTLLDGEALAGDYTVAGETAPAEGRTRPTTMVTKPTQVGFVTIVTHLEYPQSPSSIELERTVVASKSNDQWCQRIPEDRNEHIAHRPPRTVMGSL